MSDTNDEKSKKRKAWDIALGLNKMSGMEPSNYMKELIEKHIDGKITTDEIKQLLDQKYSQKKRDYDAQPLLIQQQSVEK